MRDKKLTLACAAFVLFTLAVLLVLPALGLAAEDYMVRTFQTWPMTLGLFIGYPLLGLAAGGLAAAACAAPASRFLIGLEAAGLGLVILCLLRSAGVIHLAAVPYQEPHRVLLCGGFLLALLIISIRKLTASK